MPDPTALGGPLSGEAFAFVLVLCRCGACVMLLPGLGEAEPPALLRVGFAGALALLLTPAIAAGMPRVPESPALLASMVAAELLVGATLGWLARLLALALPAAGQIVSLMTGLSSVLQPDAEFGAQSAVLGRLFGIVAPVVILASGLYALPLTALARSYAIFPAGQWLGTADLAAQATEAVGASFGLAVRLAAPFLVAGTIWQVGLGLLSRLVPQLQVYVASLPGQVLGGLLLLGLLASVLVGSWAEAVRAGFGGLP